MPYICHFNFLHSDSKWNTFIEHTKHVDAIETLIYFAAHPLHHTTQAPCSSVCVCVCFNVRLHTQQNVMPHSISSNTLAHVPPSKCIELPWRALVLMTNIVQFIPKINGMSSKHRQFLLVPSIWCGGNAPQNMEFIIYVNSFERQPHIDELGQILRRRSYHFQWIAKIYAVGLNQCGFIWKLSGGADFVRLKKRPPFRRAALTKEINCVESCSKFDKQTTEPQHETSLWLCLHQHRVSGWKCANDFHAMHMKTN